MCSGRYRKTLCCLMQHTVCWWLVTYKGKPGRQLSHLKSRTRGGGQRAVEQENSVLPLRSGEVYS